MLSQPDYAVKQFSPIEEIPHPVVLAAGCVHTASYGYGSAGLPGEARE